jgi:hypothetical protein
MHNLNLYPNFSLNLKQNLKPIFTCSLFPELKLKPSAWTSFYILWQTELNLMLDSTSTSSPNFMSGPTTTSA